MNHLQSSKQGQRSLREVQMMVVGLPFNAPDSIVHEQVELFGGKVKGTPVQGTYRDGPWTQWTLVDRPCPWAPTTSWMELGVELPTQATSKNVQGAIFPKKPALEMAWQGAVWRMGAKGDH